MSILENIKNVLKRNAKYLISMNPDTKPYLGSQLEIITDDNGVNTKLGEKVSGGMVESALEELRAKKENLNSERLHIPNALDKKHKENTR